MKTLSEEEYCDLRNDAFLLACLKAAGVDNWDGYSDAYDMYSKILEEQ